MGSLNGKRALVTGGEQGIGQAVASLLIEGGCDPYCHYYMEADGMAELNAQAQAAGTKIDWFKADLTDEAKVVEYVDSGAKVLGGIDILINNVGGLIERRVLAEIDSDFWHRVMDLNIKTMMLVTRQAVPYMAKADDGASIVNLSSLAGRKGGHPGSLVYSISKGAVLTFTRSLSNEVSQKGIRVNAICPGLILGTRFHNKHTTDESARKTVEGIPLQRAGNVEDVARAIVFFASEYDGFIAGATLDINGGVYDM